MTFPDRILAEARKHLGFREGPGNANPFSAHFGRPGEPWCADFVSYCATMAGHPLNECSVDRLLEQMKREGRFRTASGVWRGLATPRPGDLVFFDWTPEKRDPKDPANHVGLVVGILLDDIFTIEGNSGDSVSTRRYHLGDARILGYATLSGGHDGGQPGASGGSAPASARAGGEGSDQEGEPRRGQGGAEARAPGPKDGAPTEVAPAALRALMARVAPASRIALVPAALAQEMFDAYNEQGPNPWKTWDGKDVPRWPALSDQVRAKWTAAAHRAMAHCGLVDPGQNPTLEAAGFQYDRLACHWIRANGPKRSAVISSRDGVWHWRIAEYRAIGGSAHVMDGQDADLAQALEAIDSHRRAIETPAATTS